MWHKQGFSMQITFLPSPHHISVDLHMQEAQIFIPQQ